MTNQKSRPRKRNSGMGVVKMLIVSLGLALIIAFWGLFSRENDFAIQAGTAPTANVSLVDQTAVRTLTIDLPPMPTLIPPLDSTALVQPDQAVMVPVIQPQVQPSTTIFLGGSKPKSGGGGGSTASAPGAVTVTRSS